MSKICSQCGQSLNDDAKFCSKCGMKQINIIEYQDKSLYDKIIKIIVEQAGVSENECSLDTSLIDDLGLDSIDLTELIITFEDEFDIEIAEDDLRYILTIKDIFNFLKNHK